MQESNSEKANFSQRHGLKGAMVLFTVVGVSVHWNAEVQAVLTESRAFMEPTEQAR